VFAGTGVTNGQHLHDVIGTEYDRYNPRLRGPDNVSVLAHSPVKCRTLRSFSDMTYYSSPSGAGVFATGTNWWVSKFSAPCLDGSCPHDDVVIRITENVLVAFGRGPAGVTHPSTATDMSKLPTAPADTSRAVTTTPRRRTRTTTSTRSGTTTTKSTVPAEP